MNDNQLQQTSQAQAIDYKKHPIAIVGCGKFGQVHLKELLALGADIRYVCNKTDSKFSEIAETARNNGIYLTTDYNKILNDSNVSIVVIATGPHEHYDLVKKALNSGKHVVCEKPFVFTVEECEELYALAKEKTLCLLVHYSDLFTEVNLSMVGPLFYRISKQERINIFYQNYGEGPFRKDYSSIWDYGTHAAAFAYLYGYSGFYKNTKVTSFNSFAKNFTSHFSSPNGQANLTCQFGNAFINRQRGIVISAPSEIFEEYQDSPHHQILMTHDFKSLKSLPSLYLFLFKHLNGDFKLEYYREYYYRLSLFVTAFCKELEESVNTKENAN